MHLEMNTRPSSCDLIDNANPNLNGIDPARAKWAQKGGEPSLRALLSVFYNVTCLKPVGDVALAALQCVCVGVSLLCVC